jgi:uncharacterized protein
MILTMPSSIPPEQMQRYIQTAQQRQQVLAEQLLQRHRQGWEVAREASQILQQTFGAQRVVLFGSWLDAPRIHAHSDLDLAVWGLDERLYFKAVVYINSPDSLMREK